MVGEWMKAYSNILHKMRLAVTALLLSSSSASFSCFPSSSPLVLLPSTSFLSLVVVLRVVACPIRHSIRMLNSGMLTSVRPAPSALGPVHSSRSSNCSVFLMLGTAMRTKDVKSSLVCGVYDSKEAEKEVTIVVYSSSPPFMTIAQTANKQGGDGSGRSTHLGLQRAVSVREY